MSIRSMLLASAAALVVMAMVAPAQAALQSPHKVKTSLSTLNRVVDHTGRLITAKNYTRLPHENDEFKEGAEALEKAIAKEPADFQSKVSPLLTKAEADSQSVADAAVAKDDAKLGATHTAFADSVSAVLAAFPADVQPGKPSLVHEKAEDVKSAVTGK